MFRQIKRIIYVFLVLVNLLVVIPTPQFTLEKSSSRENSANLLEIKLDAHRKESYWCVEESKDSSSESSTDTVVESLPQPVIVDAIVNVEPDASIVGELPCVRPKVSQWDTESQVVVFGDQNESIVSATVNRVEFIFPNNLSTIMAEDPNNIDVEQIEGGNIAGEESENIDDIEQSDPIWTEGSYKAYLLNCHKKKRKVLNLIQLYDRAAVSSLQDKDIYKQKLEEITAAALEAAEYIDDKIDELEVNDEKRRIAAFRAIKTAIFTEVKRNEKEVKAEIQKIIDQDESRSKQSISQIEVSSGQESSPITVENLQQALASVNLGGTTVNPTQFTQTKVDKITLMQSHLKEDVSEFKKVLVAVKSSMEMSDSEVIYHMRLIKSWEKKVDDFVSGLRKLQVDALGIDSVRDAMEALKVEVDLVKTKLVEVSDAIKEEDSKRGLNE